MQNDPPPSSRRLIVLHPKQNTASELECHFLDLRSEMQQHKKAVCQLKG